MATSTVAAMGGDGDARGATQLKYNGTGATGANPLEMDVNIWYEPGDIAWMLASTALVLLMVPGVGLVGGLTCVMQLLLLGSRPSQICPLTSMALSDERIGNMLPMVLLGLLSHLFSHGMFSAMTVALATGAVAERGRMLPCVIFIFIWATIVYDPIACWTWNPNGWSNKMGVLDFAGGTPVHIASGSAALAYSMMLGKRRGHGTHELNYRPHNATHIVTGTVFLWVGWFGFNAGSALAANLRGVMAALVTNLAACVGGITWCLLDYRLERKFSTVGFCSGVVAGLVCITPGSGYVPPWAAVIFGVLGASGSNYATKVKFLLGIDDALDIFAVHGVGGLIGNICTAFFASPTIAALDGHSRINGGWTHHHWAQMGYQLADSFCGGLYSFSVTCLILFIMNLIPGLRLRASEEAEILGIDDAEIGEFAYDYVELTREVVNDVEGEAGSRYSADPTAFHPYEKHSIPMIDARMFGGQPPPAPLGFPQ
ncbi:hypothetical protein LCI18_008689 [Fusarium solani-melongenae]|uniref:Uncharacterized protein n=1 Tax=Fusarium solani subsp. cucurbitae TaxID=2747967 RepID=A0ACD3Z911_FUSSC|nr:hypothetical protein LCI18_008689 [Fusarium solani-melongenae]